MGKSVKTPEKLEFVAEYRARNATFSLIADALQINENTLKTWSTTKEFKLLYARKRLNLLTNLSDKSINSDNPKDAQWIMERIFREEYSPPTQKSETKNQHEITCLKIEFVKPNDADDPTT